MDSNRVPRGIDEGQPRPIRMKRIDAEHAEAAGVCVVRPESTVGLPSAAWRHRGKAAFQGRVQRKQERGFSPGPP